MKKRILAALLVLCLLVGVLPAAALAADDEFSIDGTVLTKYNGDATDVVIPDGVTSIGYSAFGCSSIESVTIPGSVTTIDHEAFQRCPNLTSVTIQDGVTTIGERAFVSCSSLTSVTIPDSVTTIGEEAFKYCSSLTEVTIPDNISNISDSAFTQCTGLADDNGFAIVCNVLFAYIGDATEVVIPDGVTTIGEEAFYYRSDLTGVTIPDSVTAIGANAFEGCRSITSITVPDSVTTISGSAFIGCTGLADDDGFTIIRNVLYAYSAGPMDVVIPDSVTAIGEEAFARMGITSVTIPDSVTTIGAFAFFACRKLTSITIPGSVTVFGERAFDSCSGLVCVTISDGVTTIGSQVFQLCQSLTKITIPDSVTTIRGGAFCECESLTRATIPDSVTNIDEREIFEGCDNLTIYGEAGSCAETYANENGIPFEAHTYTRIITAPTCTEAGYSTYTCECGDSYIDNEAAALGHNYIGKVTTPSTCAEEGVKTFTCSRCNKSYTRSIPVTTITVPIKKTEVTTYSGEAGGSNSKETEYAYDDIGSLSSTTVRDNYGFSTVTQYTYDEAGRVRTTIETNSNGTYYTTYYTYDDSERNIKPNTSYNYFIEYTYDENGNCILEKYGSISPKWGFNYYYQEISYTYDANGNCIGISTAVNGMDCYTITSTYTYDDNGRCLSEITDGYASSWTYTYDDNGNCLSAVRTPDDPDSLGDMDGTLSYEIHYTYDPAGNLTEKLEQTKSIVMDMECTTSITTTYSHEILGGHESITTTVTAPTCTAKGYTTHACSKCGYSYTDTETAALGHSFTNYIYNNDAKICVNGTETAACDHGCGLTNTRTKAGSALPDPNPKNPFLDVPPGQYYYNPVLWAVENKITSGTSATSFEPNTECSRAQVVTFLWRAAGRPEPTTKVNPFTDVKEGMYYYKAVLWAVENKITSGTTKTTFSPDASCTRAQVVAFLWRAAGRPEPTTTANPFTDVKEGLYYSKAVLWAVENKITSGTSKTTFSPDQICTRGQIVTFLYRDMK